MQSHPFMSTAAMAFMWFDFVVVAWLIIGLLRGRKNGMSQELLLMLQWVAIVITCALFYRPVGIPLAQALGLSSEWAFRISYVLIALFVGGIAIRIKTMVGEKLAGADLFGKGEYILGMAAGVLRFACMVIVFLALFGAHVPTPAEIAAVNTKTKDLGDVSINPLKVQREILLDSLSGRLSREYLRPALIIPLPISPAPEKKETLATRREKAVEEVMSPQISATPAGK